MIVNSSVNAPRKLRIESLGRKQAHEDALANTWFDAGDHFAQILLDRHRPLDNST
jgi:hypothetical protein